MRWERAEEPVTWTTIDNEAIDADISDRALGMLTRWLRRPPGVEIDGIPERVKRAKRDGRKRLEGRDAQYAASHELEEAGFLVRELVANSLGQHEWVVRIYSRPVPLDKRSNPEDRKRAPKRTGTTKPQVSPNTGFQESGFQESGFQESGNQEASSKNSVNNSLSGDGSDHDEREAAAPKGKTTPGGAGGVPGPREDKDGSSGTELTAEVVAMLVGLPGTVSDGAAVRLVPLVAGAVAAGWTLDGLRAHLARLCDPDRVRYAPAVYEKHLKELPPPPRASVAGAGRPAAPEGMCVRHPAFREGDCSPCRRAEMNRLDRGNSELAQVDGMGLLARLQAARAAESAGAAGGAQ